MTVIARASPRPVAAPHERCASLYPFIINLTTAQTLGLAIPPQVLLQATEVIWYTRLGYVPVGFALRQRALRDTAPRSRDMVTGLASRCGRLDGGWPPTAWSRYAQTSEHDQVNATGAGGTATDEQLGALGPCTYTPMGCSRSAVPRVVHDPRGEGRPRERGQHTGQEDPAALD